MNAAAFWAQVDTSAGPGKCWPWRGLLWRHGFGFTWINGTQVSAHRLAYMYANNVALDQDIDVKRTCALKTCMNPSHLVVGARPYAGRP